MMKKFSKIILSFVLVFVTFASTFDVFAQSNMVINHKGYVYAGFANRKEAKFNTNKGYAYCVTPSKVGAPQGTTLKYKGNINNGGLLYLLDKAKTDDTSYLTTQIAIWKYYNNYTPDVYKNNSNTTLVKNATNLANQAKSHSNYSTTPSLTVSTNSSTLTESGSDYVTGGIKVTASNLTSDITYSFTSAPSGTKLVDNAKNIVTKITSGNTYYVLVPGSSMTSNVNFKLSIKGSGVVKTVEEYYPSDSSKQNLAVIVSTPKTITNEITITGKKVTHTCEKVGNTYYGKNGTVVDATTYSIECEKHTCEKVGNTYFGKNGTIVDFDTYDIECNKHTCEKVGDKYFGKDGTIVDQTTYSIECEKHTCEIIGDKYFDSFGNLTDEATYKSQCEPEVVPVPDTASVSPLQLVLIVIGSSILGATFVVIDSLSVKKATNK